VDETIDWLRNRSQHQGRIQHHERVPGREATLADLDIDYRIDMALGQRDIDQLYQHQATAIEIVRNEQNVVLATPTASGKSLAYTIPAFERALAQGGRTLYIAPQRALINDQEETLAALADDLGLGAQVAVEQYTGQLTRDEKRAVRERQPHVVLATPDTLHYALLPWASRLWEWFFSQLDTVVIDEVHEYRGIFGSHVSLVLRRLNRVCERFDVAPTVICCSATIGNPAEHAGAVTGRPTDSFTVVSEDTSATGPTNWLFWNPPRKTDTDDDQANQPDEAATAAAVQAQSDVTSEADSSPAGTAPTPESAVSPDADDETEIGGERRSPHAETVGLFCDLVMRGYQTLVFTRSRQGAERYADWCADRLRARSEHDLADAITAYQAALKQDRREEIEEGLHDGSIRGVWSTSALELGVDVGGLDVVLLDGYPGTRMSTHQRAGRAGRGEEASLVTLVGGNDQLDQYLMTNPDSFFDGDPEHAVVNPANDQLMPEHVCSAATEAWLKPDDNRHFGESFPEIVADFEDTGDLDRRDTHAGIRWFYDGDDSPQHEMSLRTIDDREVRLVDRLQNTTIARLPFADALRDAHPEAIYHHQGTTYEVANLDLDRGQALLESTQTNHYTRALRDKQITVERDLDEFSLDIHPDVTVRFAEVTLREQIDSYLRYEGTEDDGTEILLEEPLPETTLRTRALYFTIPSAVERAIRVQGTEEDGFAGAIHAVEHGMISLFPLEMLCDRRDIGGLSTPLHPHTQQSAIFIYDGYPGGVGLARGGYERVEDLLQETRQLLADCPCESGCPACIQSPHCGNANDPLSKSLALSLLDHLLDDTDHDADSRAPNVGVRNEPCEGVETAENTQNESTASELAAPKDGVANSSQTETEALAHGATHETETDHDTAATDRVQRAIAEQIAVQTDVATETIESALDTLDGYDVRPEMAKPSLLERYGRDGPTIYDISGIGRVRGHFLFEAGYDTPEAIADASLDDLTTVPYLGDQTAPEVHDAAREYVETQEDTESKTGPRRS
jgi:DEAD/DEAH box helicase domain-containing protein